MSSPRILIVHDSFAIMGGAERVLVRVARVAHQYARLSLLLVFNRAKAVDALQAGLFDDILELDAPAEFSPASLVEQWRSRGRFRQALAQVGPAASIAFSYPAAVRLALARTALDGPTFWVCQEDVDSLLSRRLKWRRRLAFSALLKARTRIVCLNQDSIERFIALGFPATDLVLIPNSPTPDQGGIAGDVPEGECVSLRRRHSIPQADLVAVCVAHLNPVKRHDLLLEAVERARSAGTNVVLVCVGAEFPGFAEHASRLRELTASRGLTNHVLWVGGRDEVREFLALADIAVLASDHEVSPTFLLEAAAAGLPLLGSDAPGVRELIHHGETGLLFGAGDASACADAMIQLAQHPEQRLRLGQAAQTRARASAGAMERGWETLFASVLR
ncbi:MAG: glycosyltransferase family 4 protein [Vicinamibacterales bacterium]